MTRTRASSAGGTLIQSGLYAARPVAGVADRYYWATDILVMFRDTGAAWEVVSERPYIREIMTGVGLHNTSSDHSIDPNRVYYAPIQIPYTLTADGVIIVHAGVAAGNFYVALYDSLNYAPNNRLAVSVDTVPNGINRRQCTLFTAPIRIPGGLHFIAFEGAGVGDRVFYQIWNDAYLVPTDTNHGLVWYFEQLGAYAAPPAVATPVAGDISVHTILKYLRVSSIP